MSSAGREFEGFPVKLISVSVTENFETDAFSILIAEYWYNIQHFFDDFNSRNFSTSRERRELTKRAVISMGYTRLLATYIASIVAFTDKPPEPSRPDYTLMSLIDELPQHAQRLFQSSGPIHVAYRKSNVSSHHLNRVPIFHPKNPDLPP